MGKLKVLVLCTISSILGMVLMFGISHVKIKTESQLVVKGTTNVIKGDIVELSAQVANPSWFMSKAVVQWKVLHSKGVVNYHSSSPNEIFFPAGITDDKFWVLTSAVIHNNYLLWSDVVPLDVVATPVTVGAPNPNPNPPDPGPTPNPTPVTTPLWAIAIFDNTNPLTLNADQLYVHNNTEDMQTKLKPLNITWRNYDKANPSLSNPSWQALISEVGLPLIVIVDDNGKNYYKGKLISQTDTISRGEAVRSGK